LTVNNVPPTPSIARY